MKAGFSSFNRTYAIQGNFQRNSTQIINRIEDVGGDLNAYTAKGNSNLFCIFKKYIGRVLN